MPQGSCSSPCCSMASLKLEHELLKTYWLKKGQAETAQRVGSVHACMPLCVCVCVCLCVCDEWEVS